ncbi:MAG: YghX family hydrolase [Paracoccus sp. (in: a-proteobacteria)]|uniref:YghX family hydrolase n=1 Tax=Paracoccus sp. TaxID=267 RepID=UPI00391B8ED9
MTKRMSARDFSPELLELYDFYAHGKITKRQFLDRAGKYAIGGLTAVAILGMMSPDYALAEQVSFNDPDILAEWITYPSPEGHGDIRAYLVRPTGSETAPGVVVVHENRGLNPYIQDVARRLAKAGFIALAPDGLTPMGGYPGNDEEGRALQQQVDGEKLMNDFFAAIDFLAGHRDVTGKVGITGFCYGGGVANAAAVAFPDLGAAVPFYGRQADPADAERIQAALLLHFAETDENVNATWPAYRDALEAAGKEFEAHIYKGTNHGFHNDSTPRYDAAAAELAWSRTIDWFRRHLG